MGAIRSYTVSSRGLATVEVEASNWVVALGHGLEQLARDATLERLACEVLQNGTVIARDISSGTGFIVQQIHTDSSEDFEQIEDIDLVALPADDDLVMADDDDDDDDDDAIELIDSDLEALHADEESLDAIAQADTRHAACQLALQLARELVPAESGAVILEEKGFLRFLSVLGPHSRTLLGVRLPLGTGVAGFTMERQRTVVLSNATQDPRHCGEVDALTGYTTRQIVVLPVATNRTVFGVIELMNLPVKQRFTGQDVDNLEHIAAALALRIARD